MCCGCVCGQQRVSVFLASWRAATALSDLCFLQSHRFLAREGVRVSHVPDVAVAAATGHNSTRAAAIGVRQSTNEVFMVAPTAFGFNAQVRAG